MILTNLINLPSIWYWEKIQQILSTNIWYFSTQIENNEACRRRKGQGGDCSNILWFWHNSTPGSMIQHQRQRYGTWSQSCDKSTMRIIKRSSRRDDVIFAKKNKKIITVRDFREMMMLYLQKKDRKKIITG